MSKSRTWKLIIAAVCALLLIASGFFGAWLLLPKIAPTVAPDYALLQQRVQPAVVSVYVPNNTRAGIGAGFIYHSDGYILTAAHVVAADNGQPPQIQVALHSGKVHKAELIGVDPYADVAMLKIPATKLPVLKFTDNIVSSGSAALVFGTPMRQRHSVSHGIVSGVTRARAVNTQALRQFLPQSSEFVTAPNTRLYSLALQLDAQTAPGSSGGPVVDMAGQVMGMHVGKLTVAQSGQVVTAGFGLAADARVLKWVAAKLYREKPVWHGSLRVTAIPAINDANAAVLGAKVTAVADGGAAKAAGILPNDVITGVGEYHITDNVTLLAAAAAYPAAAEVEVSYLRKQKTHTVKVRLDKLK